MVKSSEEKRQELQDELSVDDAVKNATFEKAKLIFYGGKIERNPWRDNLANTMFWM